MRILWITPKWTFPVTDGARVATDSLLRNVIRSGGVVDYWSLSNKEDKPDVSEMINNWGVASASFNERSLPSRPLDKKKYYLRKIITNPFIPLTFSSFYHAEFFQEFKKKTDNGNYDFIVLDGLHLGALLKGVSEEVLNKVIYRAHNIEFDLWYKSFKGCKNPLLKLFFWAQYKLVEKFEIDLVRKVKAVAAISQEDFDILKHWNKNVALIPLGLKFKELPFKESSDFTNFIFVGRLDWPPNRDGLKWLLDEVWPHVVNKRKDAKLTIYGSGDRKWLEEYTRLENVSVIGFVPAIEDAYREAHFTLVPVFYGSGTRIKVIESFAMRRRLVSSRMGVQGAGLQKEDFLHVETKDEWISALSELRPTMEDQKKLESSIARLRDQFDEKEIGKQFYGWLSSL